MRNWALWLGPLLAALTAIAFTVAGYGADIATVGFVGMLCIVWWVFEPVPIPVTSLLPLALVALVRGADPGRGGPGLWLATDTAAAGWFSAVQGDGAFRGAPAYCFGNGEAVRGQQRRRLVMGFMVAAAALSMWISNTATTLMLLPVALAVLDATEDKERLAAPLMLGIAYAASVGGLGTPIGTPPNLIFMQVYEQTTGEAISFTRWMSWALPVVVLMVPAMALILTRNVRGSLAVSLPDVGAWRTEERG